MRHLDRLSFALGLLLLSCSSETTRPKAELPPLAANDSPQHAIQRFIGAYEEKKASEYADMFTGDFTFEFSNSTDADLVAKYSAGWIKSDETASSTHLFQGYTPSGQPFAPAASSINIDLTTTLPADDIEAVDPLTHKVLPTRVDGQIVIPPTPPATDPTNYLIENNFNYLYLVRGDQASGLVSTQPADTTHWYIYRWVDATVAFSAKLVRPSAPKPGQSATWARLKANYR